MTVIQYVVGGLLIAVALFLIVAVLMQSGKSHKLSGTIAGGAETFFGKEKGDVASRKLSTLTTVFAVVFAALVIVAFVIYQ